MESGDAARRVGSHRMGFARRGEATSARRKLTVHQGRWGRAGCGVRNADQLGDWERTRDRSKRQIDRDVPAILSDLAEPRGDVRRLARASGCLLLSV